MILNFGKYKGKTIEKIAKKDPKYIIYIAIYKEINIPWEIMDFATMNRIERFLFNYLFYLKWTLNGYIIKRVEIKHKIEKILKRKLSPIGKYFPTILPIPIWNIPIEIWGIINKILNL